MSPENLQCPYCNQPLQNYTTPVFTSGCCGKLIGVKVKMTQDVNVFIPVNDWLKKHNLLEEAGLKLNCLTGDNKPIPGVTVRSDSGRDSKWTKVYWDGDWYVRLVGGFNLEKAGLSHGLSLGTKFSTVKEACDHADMVDRVLDLIKERIIERAQK